MASAIASILDPHRATARQSLEYLPLSLHQGADRHAPAREPSTRPFPKPSDRLADTKTSAA